MDQEEEKDYQEDQNVEEIPEEFRGKKAIRFVWTTNILRLKKICCCLFNVRSSLRVFDG